MTTLTAMTVITTMTSYNTATLTVQTTSVINEPFHQDFTLEVRTK